MDYLSLIKAPISSELADFIGLFNSSLSHEDGLLGSALEHVRKRTGKGMRPILILLMAKNFGEVTEVTQHAAVGLELLHTASLIHDDVVDEAKERRGQLSVNANYDNKVAVLVGDYVLSTALQHVAFSGRLNIVNDLARLGKTLSNGEILQLSNIQNQEISEDVYYEIINNKTAALFEACAGIGALSVGASEESVAAAKEFGRNLGVIFQIRDDIFDYYDDPAIGKPTGNDMAEGKLTLPVIYALRNTDDAEYQALAKQVKDRVATKETISRLVDFAKAQGGIEYAEERMRHFHKLCEQFLDRYAQEDRIGNALRVYLDFVSERTK